MGHMWWQRLGLWISIFEFAQDDPTGILIFAGCAAPNTVAVTSPTETTDTSASVSTTVRVAQSAGFAIEGRNLDFYQEGNAAVTYLHQMNLNTACCLNG
ncbi:MAG: hypothetical protein OHK0012_11230 [Synechococcales cyanobacterium]